MLFVLDGEGKRPRSKLANGDFDDELVCRECEDLFNDGDTYAKRFFVDGPAAGVRQYAESTTYLEYHNVDYRLLKLFFISLLWRAHATSLRSYDKVNLGPKYAAKAKAMIENGDPGTPDEFAVFLIKAADGPLKTLGASPTPRRLVPNNVRVYDLLMFGYLAYIKVDSQPLPAPFSLVQLAPGRPLLMLETDISNTPFLRFAREAHLMAQATKLRLQMASASTASPRVRV